MDGVLVDFGSEVSRIKQDPRIPAHLKESPDLIEGIFENPPPVVGAIEAIQALEASKKYMMYIATTAPWDNPDSLTHKRLWIERHFGDLFKKKMFITHRKDLLIGDFLIDDRLANGAKDFKGELLRFGWDYEQNRENEYKDWASILNRLLIEV
jgi:5'-nucleotidase